jgi:hypothetical protein
MHLISLISPFKKQDRPHAKQSFTLSKNNEKNVNSIKYRYDKKRNASG